MSQEFNEMEHLERQIIKRYNELLLSAKTF